MSHVDLTPLSRQRGGSDPLHGYLARPDGPEPRPGVVMIHEIFGVDDVMRRDAERLARAGYLTLAVGGIRPDPEAAADAWRRIDAFFDEYLR